VWSSELAKLVANAMLAQRISSMNTVSAICERTGANVDNVAKAIGMDPRLGPKFLKAGLGFGGSCFKKDILSLSYLAESLDLPEVSQYWRSVVTINEYQCQRFVRGLLKKLNGSLRGKKIALLGYAFKEDTSDTRETQAAEVVRMLLQEGPSEIAIFDPQCNKEHVEQELTGLLSQGSSISVLRPKGPVNVCVTPYDACSNATAVLVLTEWKQFCYPPVLASTTTTTLQGAGSKTGRPRINTLQKDEQRHDSLMDTVPILPRPSQSPVHQSAVPGNAGRFRPQPLCPSDCGECSIGTDVARHSKDPMDWNMVSNLMHGEKWVFDGRGILNQIGLEKLGFRVEAIGKVSTRSKLRAE
jgi:UDPglucose 6-dehydrogenase